jgi:hypothetical protein
VGVLTKNILDKLAPIEDYILGYSQPSGPNSEPAGSRADSLAPEAMFSAERHVAKKSAVPLKPQGKTTKPAVHLLKL